MGEGTLDISIAGERITLLPGRAAYWHAAGTLILADLHLGKAETLLACGVPVPGAIGEEDLARLGAMIDRTGARRALIVGDLLHAPAGLTARLLGMVREWRAGIAAEFAIVPGNHDRRLRVAADEWHMQVLDATHDEGPFRFRHEPGPPDGRFTWSGHLHPMVRIGGRADGMRLPCFRVSSECAVLPAFTRLAEGVARGARAGERVFAIMPTDVFEIPTRGVEEPTSEVPRGRGGQRSDHVRS